MPSTTIHVPAQLLHEVDAAARRHRISRNRFVIAACEEALRHDQGVWPEGFFDTDLTPADITLLREAGREMENAIYEGRRNRGASML